MQSGGNVCRRGGLPIAAAFSFAAERVSLTVTYTTHGRFPFPLNCAATLGKHIFDFLEDMLKVI
jgi:hypothetical protein